MSVEVVIGTVLGIAATVIGAYTTHYFEGRREDRRAKTEEWKMVVDEVYSPLIFDLMRFRKGILCRLKALGKVSADSSGKFSQDQIASFITSYAQVEKEGQSQVLEEILRKKSRLIRPRGLWLDLYLFYSFVKGIEENFSIISLGRFKKSSTQLLEVVQSCINMGAILEDAASYLTVEIGKLVVSTAGVPQSLSYKPFFTGDIMAKMEEQHESILKALATPSS